MTNARPDCQMARFQRGLGLLAMASLPLLASSSEKSPRPSVPVSTWTRTAPEQEGLDSESLARALQMIRSRGMAVHSLVLIRHGHLVLDAEYYPYTPDEPHDLASVTKSITSTLVGTAMGPGALRSLDTPVADLYPEAPLDARWHAIKVNQLLSMTSGLEPRDLPDEVALQAMRARPNWVADLLSRPPAEAPGTFSYCSPGMHLLSGVLTRVTGQSALSYADRVLFEPLGISTSLWPSDPQGQNYGWGDLHLRPLDMAKLGLLWLHNGRWEDRQILSEGWVKAATRVQAPINAEVGYGYGFWIRPGVGLFEAEGRGGQRISVLPQLDMVVVFTGGGVDPGEIGSVLLSAVRSESPLPPNPAALSRLQEQEAEARRPPRPSPIPRLPAMAARVTGRNYRCEANPLGLDALQLRFRKAPFAQARLRFSDGRRLDLPVALNGVPARSSGGRLGLRVAASGQWISDDCFRLNYDEIANINYWTLDLRFVGENVEVSLSERSRGGEPTRFVARAGSRRR